MELCQNKSQVVRIGVLLTKQIKLTDPLNPVYGADLSWYYWRYLVKPDGTVIDLVGRTWCDIPNCAGCYYLTLTAEDTVLPGHLTVYIFDAGSLGKPIFAEFEIISANMWNAKYTTGLLSVEQPAQKG